MMEEIYKFVNLVIIHVYNAMDLLAQIVLHALLDNLELITLEPPTLVLAIPTMQIMELKLVRK
jgi:hypothetical protein